MSGPPPAPPQPGVLGLPPVPFRKLYTYASAFDIFLTIVGCASGFTAGVVLPLFSIVFGNGIDSFNNPMASMDSIVDSISTLAYFFFYIAIVAGGLTFLQVLCMGLATSNMIDRIRTAYAENLLRLDFAWYDTHRTSEAVARLAESTISISSGLTKVATVLNYTATIIAGLAIGFRTSWKLTMVIFACTPLFAIALGFVIAIAINGEKKGRVAYSRAGGAANEVLSLIRAVGAYGGERHEMRRYETCLEAARRAGVDQGRGIGLAVGVMVSTFYAIYGIALFSGAMFVIESRREDPLCAYDTGREGCFTGGQVIITFIAVQLSALSIGQIGPSIGIVAGARAAAADVFGVIDAKPVVDINDDDPKLFRGSAPSSTEVSSGLPISFKDVTFAYPSRSEEPVLRGFSLDVAAGERVGIVGTSGSGKSTLVLLAMRAYELSTSKSGSVTVDGVDTRQWHVQSLRKQLGLVQQEPILFGLSIAENIALGVADRLASEVTRAEIEAAAKKANAHEFILALPDGYETNAGSGVSSTQLSGGQRQRICIARAIIRRPKILLLDEATSALDTKSERVVQHALDTMTKEDAATTLVIAHRLSTLANMNRIVVMERGVLVESGRHEELAVKEGGVYKEMLLGQKIETKADPKALAVGATKAKALPEEDSPKLAKLGSGEDATGGAAKSAAPTADQAAASRWQILRRVWTIQRPGTVHLFPIGILAAAGGGCISPLLAIVYGGAITVFFSLDEEYIRERSLVYLGYFGLLALGVFASIAIRQLVFALVGERLIMRLRARSYGALVRLPASFYDVQANSLGALTTQLSTDSTLVKGATGEFLATVFEAVGAVICAVIIAFVNSWRLALVLMSVYPLLILGGIFEFKSYAGIEKLGNKKLEDASTVLSESISASRTVAAFGLQPRTTTMYREALRSLRSKEAWAIFSVAFGQSFQRAVLQCTYGIAFLVGARFIREGFLTFSQLINTFLAVTLSAEQMGRITASAPDVAKASNAAEKIIRLIESGEASPIDPLSEAGLVCGQSGSTSGSSGLRIEFRRVSFAYPSRPNVPVLSNFSFVIEAGQYVGVVGASGSGNRPLTAPSDCPPSRRSTLALLISLASD